MKKEIKFYYVYVITNTILNKQYIGSRICYKNNIENDNYWGSSKYLNKDYKIYGKQNFQKQVLQSDYKDKFSMLQGESDYMHKLNTLSPNGYNRFDPMGRIFFHTGGNHHTEETLLKMKKPKSEETKQKFSKAKKGKTYQEIYGDDSLYMKEQRKIQTAGSRNPNARKYLIYNSILNKVWYCSGNLSKFCSQLHVSGRTLQLSRKNNSFINNWKCEYIDNIPANVEVF